MKKTQLQGLVLIAAAVAIGYLFWRSKQDAASAGGYRADYRVANAPRDSYDIFGVGSGAAIFN